MPEYPADVWGTGPIPKAIEGVGTSTAAFVGLTKKGPFCTSPGDPLPPLLTSFAEFEHHYGGPQNLLVGGVSTPNYLALAAHAFFKNGGRALYIARIPGSGTTPFDLSSSPIPVDEDGQCILPETTGSSGPNIAHFEGALNHLLDVENISVIAAPGAILWPGINPRTVNQLLIDHTEANGILRMAVLDTPPKLDPAAVRTFRSQFNSNRAALYYPWVRIPNPAKASDPHASGEIDVPSSGAICGIYARVDAERGVWKAPANEAITGAIGLQHDISREDLDALNPNGVNCIRDLPDQGIRVWGTRTISSDPEWKYVNVARYLLFLEASITRGTQWAAAEPNSEALWIKLHQQISDFLTKEWRKGALAGTKAKQAFFTRTDHSTMTESDIYSGRIRSEIGVSLIRPAEFIILRIEQMTANARQT